MIKPKIIFNKGAVQFILDIFNLTTTENGYVYDKFTNKQIYYPDGDQVNINTIAGLLLDKDEKAIFIKNDLFSIMDIVDKCS